MSVSRDSVYSRADALAIQDERLTRRASIWRHDGQRWVLLHHQGTVIDAG